VAVVVGHVDLAGVGSTAMWVSVSVP
jgi:hypothetical protein